MSATTFNKPIKLKISALFSLQNFQESILKKQSHRKARKESRPKMRRNPEGYDVDDDDDDDVNQRRCQYRSKVNDDDVDDDDDQRGTRIKIKRGCNQTGDSKIETRGKFD